MIKIVVVEDNKNTQMEIKTILRDTEIVKNEDVIIEYYSKFCPELKSVIKNIDERKIYILDIELSTQTSGLDIAKYIRKSDWDSEIIFLTAHDKMFEATYRAVHEIYDFIEKFHNMKERLQKDVNDIFKRKYDNKMFKYSCRHYNIQIFYHSINYIYRDKEERKIIIVTNNNTYALNLSLTDVMDYLDDRFKLVHRACIVNFDHVEALNWAKGYFVLDNGEKIYMLSRKFKKELEVIYGKSK